MIDHTRVAEGLLFATPRDRCRYLGLWSWQKPQWRKDNPEKWRRLEDVEQELAQLSSPVEPVATEAGSAEANGQIRSHDPQKDGSEEPLVDPPADGSSPRPQPRSMPATVSENVPSGPTHESAVVLTRETNEF